MVEREHAILRCRAAVEACRDEGILLPARTDARVSRGFDEALARIRAFVAEGADILFLDSPQSEEEMRTGIEACDDKPALAVTKPNYLTWAILKAHTQNRAGEIVLRSADPRDPPLIDFNYFEEGSDTAGEDLDSVVAGIRFARKLTAKLKAEGLIAEEEQPGEARQSDEELKDYVRTAAWGHHASCTCPIGPREDGGVLGGDFRVHGTEGLRVVDASVFPRIPGFFIVSAVYMVAEKAADVILAS